MVIESSNSSSIYVIEKQHHTSINYLSIYSSIILLMKIHYVPQADSILITQNIVEKILFYPDLQQHLNQTKTKPCNLTNKDRTDLTYRPS
jgi:hypothetical protein